MGRVGRPARTGSPCKAQRHSSISRIRCDRSKSTNARARRLLAWSPAGLNPRQRCRVAGATGATGATSGANLANLVVEPVAGRSSICCSLLPLAQHVLSDVRQCRRRRGGSGARGARGMARPRRSKIRMRIFGSRLWRRQRRRFACSSRSTFVRSPRRAVEPPRRCSALLPPWERGVACLRLGADVHHQRCDPGDTFATRSGERDRQFCASIPVAHRHSSPQPARGRVPHRPPR